VAAAGTAQALDKAPARQALASATGLSLGTAATAVAQAAGVSSAQRKTRIGTTMAGLVAEVTMPAVQGSSKDAAYAQ